MRHVLTTFQPAYAWRRWHDWLAVAFHRKLKVPQLILAGLIYHGISKAFV